MTIQNDEVLPLRHRIQYEDLPLRRRLYINFVKPFLERIWKIFLVSTQLLHLILSVLFLIVCMYLSFNLCNRQPANRVMPSGVSLQ